MQKPQTGYIRLAAAIATPRGAGDASSASNLFQILVLDRQGPNSLSGCCKNGIAECRRQWGRCGLADAAPEAPARYDHRHDLWHVGKTQNLVVVEVALLDTAVTKRDFAVERGRQRVGDRPLDLHFDGARIDDVTRVDGRNHAVHANFARSEEHTSELQSPCNLVCRLLLEKKK